MIKLNKARANVKASSRKRKNEKSTRQLRFEGLEERELLAILNIPVNTEAGLRAAIVSCNNNPNLMGTDKIRITSGITLTQQLPTIVEGIIIDGDVPDPDPEDEIPIIDGGKLKGVRLLC